jgi:hypothetical protein
MKRSLALGLVILQMLLSRPLSHAETLPRESLERLRATIQILVRSPRGKGLVEQAKRFWKVDSDRDLSRFLKWDRASRTDAVLIRHFNPKTGTEEREREVTISLRSQQKLEEVVLDLAHELSHALSKPIWDPYDPKLTAGDYLHSALEGRGGEIEAVGTECRVAQELVSLVDSIDLSRCDPYVLEGQVRIERIREDFYRVGNWYPRLASRLGADLARFPLLSSKAPKLFSSTGHSPYPVALFEEFEQITAAACDNSRSRLKSFSGREPASVPGSSEGSVREFLNQRCN